VGVDTTETIRVRSMDVRRVEKAAREVTSLLEQGVSITSPEPSYYYTKLGELKVEMLAAAARDARARAENVVKSTGGATIGLRQSPVGHLRRAEVRQGLVQAWADEPRRRRGVRATNRKRAVSRRAKKPSHAFERSAGLERFTGGDRPCAIGCSSSSSAARPWPWCLPPPRRRGTWSSS
jgi:hypothetical protein